MDAMLTPYGRFRFKILSSYRMSYALRIGGSPRCSEDGAVLQYRNQLNFGRLRAVRDLLRARRWRDGEPPNVHRDTSGRPSDTGARSE